MELLVYNYSCNGWATNQLAKGTLDAPDFKVRESNGKGRESYPMIQIVYLHGSDKFHRICESLMIIIITGVWGWIQRKIRRDGGRERGSGGEREREREGRSCTLGYLL